MLQGVKCCGIKKRDNRIRGIKGIMKRGIEVVILNTEFQLSFIEKVNKFQRA